MAVGEKTNKTTRSSDELALDRTVFAAERTLLAWLRTALSMIGFGFTAYVFLRSLKVAGYSEHRPRNFALTLIGLGTVSLLVAVIQHVAYVKCVQGSGSRWSMVTIAGILVALIGVVAFLNVAVGAGPF